MLVLARQTDERIFIDGGRIVITVVRIEGDKVKLGIEANGIRIDREEVHLARERGRNQ